MMQEEDRPSKIQEQEIYTREPNFAPFRLLVENQDGLAVVVRRANAHSLGWRGYC
jgi:hypothetical protein